MPYAKVFKGDSEFEELVQKAQSENWRSLPLGERTVAVGVALLGTPYANYTLEIDDHTESPSVNLRGVDCWTYFEISLGFARMLELKNGGYSPADLLAMIELDRYRGGQCNGKYTSRLHYLEDWIYDNERRGLVTNLTRSLGRSSDAGTLSKRDEQILARLAISSEQSANWCRKCARSKTGSRAERSTIFPKERSRKSNQEFRMATSFVSAETVRKVSLNMLDWRIVIAQVFFTSCTHRRTHGGLSSTCRFTAIFTGTANLPESWLSGRGKLRIRVARPVPVRCQANAVANQDDRESANYWRIFSDEELLRTWLICILMNSLLIVYVQMSMPDERIR